MTSPTFTVLLHELDDGPKELTGPLTHDWLRAHLADTDVEPAGEAGKLDVLLTKSGQEVLVQGSLQATISVPCARTLDPAVYEIRPEVFLMLSPAAGQVTTGRRAHRERRRQASATANARAGSKPGKGWEKDPVLSEEDAAADTYSGERVVLDHFLREFILLEVPMIPLREDLRGKPFEANPPLPGSEGSPTLGFSASPGGSQTTETADEKPLDPRLSALAEIKARLEKKD